MGRVAGLGALAVLVPDLAAACATCTSSAFGDLSFTWPYVALLLLPLVVTGVVGGVIIYCYRRGRVDARARLEPTPSRVAPAADGARPSPEGVEVTAHLRRPKDGVGVNRGVDESSSSAGSAGATLGEASEGAVKAPSDSRRAHG